MSNRNKLTKHEISKLALLVCPPTEEFIDKYQRESFIKGFTHCAYLFQMLGWNGNEKFFKRVKNDLHTDKTKEVDTKNSNEIPTVMNRASDPIFRLPPLDIL